MFTALKDRTLALARSPHAERGLFVLAFAESSFFPIPPDVVLGPMAAASPLKWARYAFICAAGSVLGAFLGYAIGFYMAETLGKWILDVFGLSAQFEHFRSASAQWAPWVILGQGLLPVPYKLVTIASGMLKISLALLIGCSIITRSTRFFAVAFLFQKYGPQIGAMVEKRIGLAMVVLGALVVVAIVALWWLHH